jgi:hypothetical protein
MFTFELTTRKHYLVLEITFRFLKDKMMEERMRSIIELDVSKDYSNVL